MASLETVNRLHSMSHRASLGQVLVGMHHQTGSPVEEHSSPRFQGELNRCAGFLFKVHLVKVPVGAVLDITAVERPSSKFEGWDS